MADTKALRGPAPKETQSEGIPVSNSSTRKPRATSVTKARKKEEVVLPPIGEKDQVWLWRQGGSGTFTIPATFKINIDGKQDTILYSEGAGEVLMSKMRDWNEKPVKSYIRMRNSMLHVPADNQTLQRYLTYLVYLGGYSDVYLDDPEAEARKEAERFELEDANTESILSLDVVALRAVANSLSIGVDSITPKRAVINRLRSFNKKNPQELSKALHNDGGEVYFISSEVFVNGFADVNNGTIVWEDGGSIVQVPANQDPKTFLAMEILNNDTLRGKWLAKMKKALAEHYPE